MMIIVKLFVLLMCLGYVRSASNKYCEICVNHTLCVYPVAGPSAECSKYNAAVSLTTTDRVDIVNRINERRNFIALGRLHLFPEAANMKKTMWSTELAAMAQRWVDQCDQSVKPDKKDECRDLAHTRVGQNIATVVGPSPGINVKSLVDMWFMENIFFTGTVTYYNQTSNSRASNFAQLIWAETEFVGCSKAQFYIDELRTIVLRLICNFAPSGSLHGKPIYIVGLPSTQCSRNTVPSSQFLGLCQRPKRVTMFNVETPTARNLLRVLNLSNDSMKQELDPNNSKPTNLNNSEFNNKRHQKTRHAYLNNRYGAIKRDSFHIDTPAAEDYKNHQFTPERGHSRMYHGHQTRKENPYNSEPVTSYTEQNFRRVIDFSTIPPLTYTDKKYRKYFINGPQECTRKIQMNDDKIWSGWDIVDDCCPKNNNCETNDRPRSHAQNCQPKPNICENTPCPPSLCQCRPSHQANSLCCEHTACSTPATECAHSPKCQCSNQICPSNPLPVLPCAVRRSEGGEVTKSTPFNHYDVLPNINVRSGDRKLLLDGSWYHDTVVKEESPILGKIRDSNHDQQVKQLHDISQNKDQRDFQDSYHYFDSSARRKRDLEDQTFKPFWQVDEYSFNKPSDLKSIRYTTMNRRRKKPPFAKFMTSTETITINLKDVSENNRASEKILSFDELMHLRKLNNDYPYVYDSRRRGENFLRDKNKKKDKPTPKKTPDNKKKDKPTPKKTPDNKKKDKPTPKKTPDNKKKDKPTPKKTPENKKKDKPTPKKTPETKKKDKPTQKPTTAPPKTTPAPPKTTPATTKMTAATTNEAATTTATMPSVTDNTPFIRLSHCTRKLTCTWTARMKTTDGGRIVVDGGGGGIDMGPKTPPGYVDGCTRTSTCTRDYMGRNKFETIGPEREDDGTGGSGDDGDGDGSAIDDDMDYCQRRDLNVRRRDIGNNKATCLKSTESLSKETVTEISVKTNENIEIQSTTTVVPCVCNKDTVRSKRNSYKAYDEFSKNHCSSLKHEPKTSNNLRKTSRRSIASYKCACGSSKPTKIVDNIFLIFIECVILKLL